MTKIRLALLTLVPMFALAVACGDDDGGDGGGGAIDAPTIDAPSSAVDAATGDASAGTMCGSTLCTTTEECCVSGSEVMCVAADTCAGVTFECDGPEDCATAGDVCCYGGGASGGTSCVPSADCDAPACRTMADCPEQNQQCCMVGQFGVCARNCPGGP